ncbi:MAG: magnesium-translocating P-type ATPase [Vigna little leaf phytoplasma]|nr:magnesium-translocating P-type ATPase [Vigna little leaf phytoplasma]
MKKKINKNNSFPSNITTSLQEIRSESLEKTLKILETNIEGLTIKEVLKRQITYGQNILEKKKNYWSKTLINILFNPFNIILLFLIICSVLENVLNNSPTENNYFTSLLIVIIWFISNIIHFVQRVKFSKISEKLNKIVETTVSVQREHRKYQVSQDDLVIGDIVYLSAGDIIPADIKLLDTKDFFVKETSLTGENTPIEKKAFSEKEYANILEDVRIVFSGTNVISGNAKGVVVAIGKNTYLGKINKIVLSNKQNPVLKKEINKIFKLLSFGVLLLFPLIVSLNWLKSPNINGFLQSLAFTLTIILGITPEMLPLIINTFFSKGVATLSKEKIIVKNLYSISDFGTIEILFTDKTGTLTDDNIDVGVYLDLNNKTNEKILEYAFLNSFLQKGLKNPIDIAIIKEFKKKNKIKNLTQEFEKKFKKIDEIPFDFKRRIMSIVIYSNNQKSKKIISKGAIEEVLNICDRYQILDPYTKKIQILPINKQQILNNTQYFNQKGFRVIGIAYKKINYDINNDINSHNLEKNMIMIGFLTFYDKPKKNVIEAIQLLKENYIKVKMLTGDNEILAKNIANQIKLDNPNKFLLGKDIKKIDDNLLYQEISKTNTLAKLSPEQKSRIVSIFREKGHIVGFLGDGINDAAAMKVANLSISVDSGVDIAKESADVILLEKDLRVLIKGISEGRKMYTNTLKYIKFTLAANFGNILSIILASICLTFIPLIPIQILFLNLIYDISCLGLVFDNVDEIYLKKPRKYNLRSIIYFMILFGSLSFIFDILFYTSLIKLLDGENIKLIRTSWFVFSICTQILTIYNLRTENYFKNSQINRKMLILSLLGNTTAIVMTFMSFFQKILCFENPFTNKSFIILLISILILYYYCLSITKKIFIKKHRELI